MRDSRYDVLFEPLDIGPVTAPNRFYQVPRCNGGGYRDPSAVAEMRRVKAEGGWGVIFTEQVEMHHVRHIRKMGDRKPTGFRAVMRALNRKQIPACATCHRKIHNGEYDGIRLTDLAYDFAARPT